MGIKFNPAAGTILNELDKGITLEGFVYPSADGSANHYMKTDGSGNLTLIQPDYSHLANTPTLVTALGGLSDVDLTGLIDNSILKYNLANTAWEISTDDTGAGVTNLTYTAATGVVASSTGTDATITLADGTNRGLMTNTDFTKLAGIEAAADVTDATNVAAAGAVMATDILDSDTMTGALSTNVASSESVKAYVDAEVAGAVASEMSYKGALDASTPSPALNTITSATGDMYTVTVAGTITLTTGTLVLVVGDVVIAESAGVLDDAANWTIVNKGNDAATIKTLYESNGDTNEFSDAEQSKLAAIEASATADQTDAEIKTAYENNANTNAFTDANVTTLGSALQAITGESIKDLSDVFSSMIPSDGQVLTFDTTNGWQAETASGSATALSTGTVTTTTYGITSDGGADDVVLVASTTSTAGLMTSAMFDKLDAIEASATADQTGAEIKSAYEGESDTNAFTDAEKTKLSNIEASATADQTGAEIKTLLDAETGHIISKETVTTSDASITNAATLAIASGDTTTWTLQGHGKEAATGDVFGFTMSGCIKNHSGTTALVGETITTIFQDTGAAAWDIDGVANDTSDQLEIKVTGEAAHTIVWNLTLRTTTA